MNAHPNFQKVSGGTSCTKLYVRYMVSLRCKIFTKSELIKMGIPHLITSHGALEFPEGISKQQQLKLKKSLRRAGLDLLDASESIIVDKIINTIIEVIHYSESLPKLTFKDILHENLGSESTPILKIFSEVTGVSVTNFIILQKVERAKELLLYHDYSVKEISELLNYRNKDFFLAQFKKHTDLTPAYYLDIKKKREKNISELKLAI